MDKKALGMLVILAGLAITLLLASATPLASLSNPLKSVLGENYKRLTCDVTLHNPLLSPVVIQSAACRVEPASLCIPSLSSLSILSDAVRVELASAGTSSSVSASVTETTDKTVTVMLDCIPRSETKASLRVNDGATLLASREVSI